MATVARHGHEGRNSPGGDLEERSGRDPAGQGAPSEQPGEPLEVSGEGRKATLRRTLKRAQRDRVSMMAGSVAYQGFLSLFPLIIALIGITALLKLGGSQVSHLVNGIGRALPQGASGVLSEAVKAAQHRTGGAVTATVVAILVAIWSASSGMATLQTGLDIAYAVPEDLKYLPKRLRALKMLGVTVLVGGLASVLVVFAKPLGHAIESHVPISGTAFTVGWTVVRWVVALALMVILFSYLYRTAPNRRAPGWRWLSVGGVVATAVWLLASLGLSFYDSAFGSYGKTYGASRPEGTGTEALAQGAPQPMASAVAAQMALRAPGLARPTRRTSFTRGTSWRLSRLTTQGVRTPSASESPTSVLRPRTVDVTGPTITECSSRPKGSRVSTTTGRRLSRSASQISPRLGAGPFSCCRATRHPNRCRRRGRASRVPPSRE